MSQTHRQMKTEEMHKLRRGMQRVRTKCNRLQQDPIQKPLTSITGIQPRELLEEDYYEHHNKDQDRVQVRHEHDLYVDLYSTKEQQIRADAILSR